MRSEEQRARRRGYQAKYKAARRALGQCVSCKEPALPNRSLCSKHRDRHNERNRERWKLGKRRSGKNTPEGRRAWYAEKKRDKGWHAMYLAKIKNRKIIKRMKKEDLDWWLQQGRVELEGHEETVPDSIVDTRGALVRSRVQLRIQERAQRDSSGGRSEQRQAQRA